MKNLMNAIALGALILGAAHAEDRLPERKRIPANWMTVHTGVFSACKCIRIIDYSPRFGKKRNDFYECTGKANLAAAVKWLNANAKGLLNTVPVKPVGHQGASRPRFVLTGYASKSAEAESEIFAIPIGVLLKGFDRAEFDKLAEQWGAVPYQ